MSTDNFWNYFHEIYEAIPRQGPGDRKSTERALRLLPKLDNNPEALAVASRSQREIDLYQEYVGAFGYVFFVMQRDDSGIAN